MTSRPNDAPRPETPPLGIVLDAEKKALQAIEQMRPVLEAAANESRKVFEAVAENASFSDLFKQKETILWVPPREYPSTEEIADAVAKKMKLEGKTAHRNRTEKLIPIPDGARWEDIRLDLKDNRSIDVFYKNEPMGNCGYEDLGLVRKNTSKNIPDKQSKFLERLSLASMPGNSSKMTVENMASAMGASKEMCHQIKKSLSEKLRFAFKISGQPFFSYDPAEGYRPRFELKPIPLFRGDGELHASGGSLYDETTDYSDSDERY